MKKLLIALLCSLFVLSLAACGNSKKDNTKETSKDEKTLTIGATPVPHAEILNHIKPILEEKGVKLEIMEFTDYVKPNLALHDKEIDANFFQHVPYMDTFAKDHDIKLFNAGKIHVEPLGLYSKKVQDIKELKDRSQIALPNDPSNLGRALILLENNSLLKLKDGVGLEATKNDISENPHNLKITEIDAAQLPRTLDDVDAAVINTNYALEANINPSKDALLIEGSESPYANIITIRPEDKDNEKIKLLIETLQSEDLKKFLEEKYNGAIVPAF